MTTNISTTTEQPAESIQNKWDELGLVDFDILMRKAAQAKPDAIVLKDVNRQITWSDLDKRINKIANSLITNNVKPNEHVTILAKNSITYAEIMFGTQRAGARITPLPSLASAETIVTLLQDCHSKVLFVAEEYFELIEDLKNADHKPVVIEFDSETGTYTNIEDFISEAPDTSPEVFSPPEYGFNLIYSSGTTGLPKGILHDRAFRAREASILQEAYEFKQEMRTIISTPFYSNTTLFYFFATIANGGMAYLMKKFDAEEFLQISEREKITNVILVPVQYERVLRVPDFEKYDLSSFKNKCSTSAPFRAAIKKDLLERWPAGGLYEIYGMTEGGVGTMLAAHEYPDKLDTVGFPSETTHIKIIDDEGNVLPDGQVGELVGRSHNMMVGYLNRQEATKEASWYDEDGLRYHRSGDTGWIDEDGFIHLLDRKKDMIISGGFNIYATDLENTLLRHENVLDVAVIGAPSEAWGETPVAFVVPKQPVSFDAEQAREWANSKLGKVQRISEIRVVGTLPRSAIGKVLKTELRKEFPQL
ncbi:MAG: class I adenylate-forming enzyme family protein [Methyloligellaceae bacterium]